METEDVRKVFDDLRKRKDLSFREFLLGYEGGLDTMSLQSAGIDCVDIRYTVLEGGTKVYTLKPGRDDERIHVYSLNIETLQTILAASSSITENSSDSIACIGVYELTYAILSMRIREDIASEVCVLWTKSKDKENVPEETDVKDYRKLMERKNPNVKNFLDRCFTLNDPPCQVEAVVYTRQSSSYQVLVTGTWDGHIPFLRKVQDLVLPKSAIGKLTVDLEGYLRPSGSKGEPTHATPDCADRYAKMKEEDVFEEPRNGSEAVPSYDANFPTPEEYNDYKAEDHSLDYESIAIRPFPQESSTQITSARPDQPPPPPPVAEPVYSTIDKSAKKPKGRSNSVDQVDAPTTPTGSRPPRPPPLDTMPHSDGESPAQINVSLKPSRPSAPPKILRSKAHSVDAGMGSAGNVSLDGKDDSLTPPPRSSQKVKGRQKSETSTRF